MCDWQEVMFVALCVALAGMSLGLAFLMGCLFVTAIRYEK